MDKYKCSKIDLNSEMTGMKRYWDFYDSRNKALKEKYDVYVERETNKAALLQEAVNLIKFEDYVVN